MIDEPQLVVEKEIETKKSEKGLLNKIAVKKQDGGEKGGWRKRTRSIRAICSPGSSIRKRDGSPADRLSELEKEEENTAAEKEEEKSAVFLHV